MRYLDPTDENQEMRSTGTHLRREADRIAAKWEHDLREGRQGEVRNGARSAALIRRPVGDPGDAARAASVDASREHPDDDAVLRRPERPGDGRGAVREAFGQTSGIISGFIVPQNTENPVVN